MRLGGIGCNEDCCETKANTKDPEATENASYLKTSDRKNGVGGRANAWRIEEGRGRRGNHILNSMWWTQPHPSIFAFLARLSCRPLKVLTNAPLSKKRWPPRPSSPFMPWLLVRRRYSANFVFLPWDLLFHVVLCDQRISFRGWLCSLHHLLGYRQEHPPPILRHRPCRQVSWIPGQECRLRWWLGSDEHPSRVAFLLSLECSRASSHSAILQLMGSLRTAGCEFPDTAGRNEWEAGCVLETLDVRIRRGEQSLFAPSILFVLWSLLLVHGLRVDYSFLVFIYLAAREKRPDRWLCRRRRTRWCRGPCTRPHRRPLGLSKPPLCRFCATLRSSRHKRWSLKEPAGSSLVYFLNIRIVF